MSQYPGTIDSYNVIGTSNYMDESGYVLHEQLNSHGSAAVNIETVLGTTAGTSVLKDFTAGEFAVARNSGGTLQDTITAGTINNAVLGSPTVTGGTLNPTAGTFNAVVLGTPAVTGGTFTSPIFAGTPVLDGTSAIPFYGDNMARQAIMNGNFDVWQRGTSFTATGYTADRWQLNLNGSSNTTTRQGFALGQTNVPKEPTYYLSNVVTTSAGAGNYVFLRQPVESVRTFAGKTVTLTFYAKADSAKNIAIEFVQNFGSGGTPSSTVTSIGSQKIALTTSWAKYTATAGITSISGKTVGTTHDGYLGLHIWFDAGSDFNARTDSLGQQSGTFDIAQVQLCAGDVALPFQPKSYVQELQDCQRYYYQMGSNSGTSPYNNYGLSMNYGGTISRMIIQHPVTMRGEPSIVTTGTAGNYELLYSSGGTAIVPGTCTAVPTAVGPNIHTSAVNFTIASGLTIGESSVARNSNNTVGFIGFNAEL